MMPVALGIEGMSAALDPATGAWDVTAEGVDYTLRPWRWKERERLVAAASVAGVLNLQAYLDGLVALLYAPEPPAELVPLFSFAAMRLMGVPEDGEVPPLSEATRFFAERFHWTPGMLDGEAAADLDRLLAGSLPPVHAPPEGPGWVSIRFDAPDGAGAG